MCLNNGYISGGNMTENELKTLYEDIKSLGYVENEGGYDNIEDTDDRLYTELKNIWRENELLRDVYDKAVIVAWGFSRGAKKDTSPLNWHNDLINAISAYEKETEGK